MHEIEKIVKQINNNKIKASVLDLIDEEEMDEVLEYLSQNNVEIIYEELNDTILTDDILRDLIVSTKEYQNISSDEQAKLVELAQHGDIRAKEKLICSCLLLIISIAKKYQFNTPMIDLVQEGSIGVMVAIDKYDKTKGASFGTYAYCCVKTYIIRYVQNNDNIVRIPIHQVSNYTKIKKMVKNNPYITETEIADELKLDIETVRLLLKLSDSITSLDVSIGSENDDISMISMITDENVCVEADVIDSITNSSLKGMLEHYLEPAESKIICLRYGFEDDNCLSSKEISKLLNINEKIVLRLERQALKKLRYFFYKKESENKTLTR